MKLAERQALIAQLEAVRKSRVLCYVLSDRLSFPDGIPGFGLQLGMEPILPLIDHCRKIGKTERLDLFLHTRGGDLNSVWPVVSLLREHTKNFTVIVPFRAHSGGTLICLAAHEVIMTDVAELSPIDPTTGNQFNPADPTNPRNRFGISVEDVTSYFELAEAVAGITSEPLKLEVFKELTRQVHPLALGNIRRVHTQIRELACYLLKLHLDPEADAARITKIVKALTEEFRSHAHVIKRSEAVPLLGDWVREPTAEEDKLIWSLFDAYADTLHLREKFNLPEEIADSPVADLGITGAFIEDTASSHVFATKLNIIQRPNLPPNVNVQVPPGQPIPLVPWASRAYDFSIRSVGWSENSDGI